MVTRRLILSLAVFTATLVAPTSLSASVIVVDDDAPAGGNGKTWKTAFRNLQDGLFTADVDLQIDEIRVVGGVYKPDLDEHGNVVPGSRSESFQLRGGVRLLGGFAGLAGGGNPDSRDLGQFVSILNGDLARNDGADFQNRSENSFHVVSAIGVGSSLLDGFTVTGGNANGSAPDDNGGGIRLESSSLLVSRCSITGNRAVMGGGGLYITGIGANGPAALVRCTVTQNRADGRGGGLRLFIVHGFQMQSCRFVGNQAFIGGGIASDSDLQEEPHSFINSLFIANTASDGGGIMILGSNDSIINCTIAQNRASIIGGGLFVQGAEISIANTLIWKNEDPHGQSFFAQVARGGLGQATIEHSCVQGIDAEFKFGDTNIGADPQFLDQLGPDGVPGSGDEDFRLSPGSACADAGDNSRVPADRFDLDGDGDTAERVPLDLADLVRFTDDPLALDVGVGPDPIVDVGAFEVAGPVTPVPAVSEWGMVAMTLIVLVAGTLLLRYRVFLDTIP